MIQIRAAHGALRYSMDNLLMCDACLDTNLNRLQGGGDVVERHECSTRGTASGVLGLLYALDLVEINIYHVISFARGK